MKYIFFTTFLFHFSLCMAMDVGKYLCVVPFKKDQFAIGTEKKGLCILNVIDNVEQIKKTMFSHQEIHNLCVKEDILATVTSDSVASLYNPIKGELTGAKTIFPVPLQLHRIPLLSTCLISKDKLFIYLNGNIIIYDSKENIQIFGEVKCRDLTERFSHNPTKKQFFCFSERNLYLVNYTTKASKAPLLIKTKAREIITNCSSYEEVLFSPSGKEIAIRNTQGEVFIGILSKLSKDKHLPVLELLKDTKSIKYTNMCFHPCVKSLVLFTNKKIIQYWNYCKNICNVEKSLPIGQKSGNPAHTVFSNEGKKILILFNKKIFLFDTPFISYITNDNIFIGYKVLMKYYENNFIPKDTLSLIITLALKEYLY